MKKLPKLLSDISDITAQVDGHSKFIKLKFDNKYELYALNLAQEDGWMKTTSKLSFESGDKVYSYITPEGYLLDWQVVFTHFDGSEGIKKSITFLFNEKNKKLSKQIEYDDSYIIPDFIWEKYIEINPKGFLYLPTRFFYDDKKINEILKLIEKNILSQYDILNSEQDEEKFYKDTKILIHKLKEKIQKEKENINKMPGNQQKMRKKEENKQNIQNLFENINN